MIRMTHPEHGFHDAQTSKEAEEMKKNGWAPIPAEPVADKAKDKG